MSLTESPAEVVIARRPYQTPQLVKYGDVRQLTQTGVSSGFETNSTPGTCPPGQQPQPRFSCAASDRRMKENIVRIGEHPMGFGLYLFDYKPSFQREWGAGRQFGVMADEVEPVIPQAVVTGADGYQAVHYELLGIHRHLH